MEVITVLALASILLGLSVPSFTSLLSSSRLSSQRDDFIADIRTARSEAATRQVWFVMCPSRDAATCSSSAADWSVGRLVFADTARTGVPANHAAIVRTSALSGKTTVTPSGFTDVYLTFSPYGGLLQGGVVGGSGAFKLCAPGNAIGKSVLIDTGGRPRSGSATCP